MYAQHAPGKCWETQTMPLTLPIEGTTNILTKIFIKTLFTIARSNSITPNSGNTSLSVTDDEVLKNQLQSCPGYFPLRKASVSDHQFCSFTVLALPI